jgi:hypothetical protein
MLSSPVSCHFVSLRSKYSPQHTLFKHPKSIKVDRKLRLRGQYFIKARHLRFMGNVLWQHCKYASRGAFIITQCVCEKLSFSTKVAEYKDTRHVFLLSDRR